MRSRSLSRALCLAMALAGMILVEVPARAGWTLFFVTDATGAKIAQVAEQIFPAALAGFPAAYGLDYEFRVLNISPNHAAINGFDVFVGNQAGLALQQSFVNPPHIPSGYGAQFGPVGNASVPFLTAEGNTFSPVPWQFQESDQRPGVMTGYKINWTFTGGQPLPWNRWTQFDLFSTLGPVPGGGAVDPFSGPGGLGVDLSGTGLITSDFTSDVPVDQTRDTSNPYPNSTPFGPGSVPEPSTLLMMGMGLALLACAKSPRVRCWP